MRLRSFLTVAAVIATLLGVIAPTAHAIANSPAVHAVFVQTNQLTGNAIQVYDRASDGTLTAAGLYPTGGNGGDIPNPFPGGSGAFSLTSQDSLTYVPGFQLLLAVNAGSNTLTVFSVNGDRLIRKQILNSGGQFPTSVVTNGNLVYVLNAGGPGAIAAFRISTIGLVPVFGGVTSLNDGNTTSPPPYTLVPSGITITPDGKHVAVAFGPLSSDLPPTVLPGWIQTYNLDASGRTVVGSMHKNDSAIPGPFAFLFTPGGQLAVVALDSGVETYQVNADGTLTLLSSAQDGGVAACWLRAVKGFYYVSNTESNSLSAFTINSNGQVNLVNPNPVVSLPGHFPIDLAVSGNYLYVQVSDAGEIIGYHVNNDGSLTQAALATGLPVYDHQNGGMEGIAAN